MKALFFYGSAALIFSLCWGNFARADQAYQSVSPATFFGDDMGSQAIAINDAGWVLGYRTVQPQPGVYMDWPTMWNTAAGESYDIPLFEDFTNLALHGLSRHGALVVGEALRVFGRGGQAFIWTQAAGPQKLPLYGDHNLSSAMAVTQNRIVGWSGGNNHQLEPCVWTFHPLQDPHWQPEMLPIQTTGYSDARAISPNGQLIAGHQNGKPVVWRATLWGWEQIFIGDQYGYIQAINNRGEMAGKINLPGGLFQAFYANLGDQQIVPIPFTNKSHDTSEALDISRDGVVVGTSKMSSEGASSGFIWTVDGGLETFDLGGQPLVQLYSINDRGMLLGQMPQPSQVAAFGYYAVKMFVTPWLGE